jgi:GNAT superfamily N-acetyltransferase
MSVLLKRLLDMPLAPSRVFIHCNTGITRAIWDRKGVLVQGINDTRHIPSALLSGGGIDEGWWPKPKETVIHRYGDLALEAPQAHLESLKLREEHLFQRESLSAESYEEIDARSVHFIAFRFSKLAGFVQYDPVLNRLRQLFVLPSARGSRVGQELVRSVEQEALRHGKQTLFVNAWEESIGFYSKCGFVREGEPYRSNAVQCQRMILSMLSSDGKCL